MIAEDRPRWVDMIHAAPSPLNQALRLVVRKWKGDLGKSRWLCFSPETPYSGNEVPVAERVIDQPLLKTDWPIYPHLNIQIAAVIPLLP